MGEGVWSNPFFVWFSLFPYLGRSSQHAPRSRAPPRCGCLGHSAGCKPYFANECGQEFEFVGPLGTHNDVADIHPKKPDVAQAIWPKSFARATTARRDRGGSDDAAVDKYAVPSYAPTDRIHRMVDVALQLCSCCSHDDVGFFGFQKRVPCIPRTLHHPPERRARRTPWASAPTKRKAGSLGAPAAVELEARPANPMRGTRHCIK